MGAILSGVAFALAGALDTPFSDRYQVATLPGATVAHPLPKVVLVSHHEKGAIMTIHTPLPTCQQDKCPGHIGKFSSCQAEALWDMSLEDGRGFGDTDFEGYFSRVDVTTSEDVELWEGMRRRTVTVAPGWYTVHTTTAGWVATDRYDTEAEREAALKPAEDAYLAWELSE